MVAKCLECKYFNENKEGRKLGSCELLCQRVFPYETCENFTAKVNNPSNRIDELERRIERLESIVMRKMF